MAVGALVCGLVGAVTVPAAADPSDPPADPVPGEELCSVADPRLAELSGLVADGDNFWAVPDGTQETAQLEIFKLDAECNILESVLPYKKSDGQAADAADPEDLALDDKGRLWVADFGDNDKVRETIALWRVDPQEPNSAELYRMSFPDGPHDAETLLLQPDGTPIVVTKDASVGMVFKPAGKLENEETTELEAAGEFTFEQTGTEGGPVGPPGQLVATGGAVSADGTKAVIRSYTDAYEWDVADGDVAAAVGGDTAPQRTALPNEPQGEAITFGADGKYVTGTESDGEDGATLYTYTPTVPAAPEDEATDADDSGGLFSDLTLDQTILLAGGSVGALGLILAVVGVIVIMKARKRRRLEGDGDGEPDGDGPDDDDDPRSRYAAAPGPGGYDRREEVYDPRDRYDDPRGYDRDPRDPRDDPYGRREEPYDRGYQAEAPGGYDDRAHRPEYRDAPAQDERYAPPPPAGGYRDDSGSRYDGGPAPRPDRGGAVYGGGGGGARRDEYGRDEQPYDSRPDFGIPRDEPRGY